MAERIDRRNLLKRAAVIVAASALPTLASKPAESGPMQTLPSTKTIDVNYEHVVDTSMTVNVPSVSLFPGQTWPLSASAYAIDSLTIPNGCSIYVMSGITQVEMTINTLTLSGDSKFDLTSDEATDLTPLRKPETHQQPPPEHHKGDDGETGAMGHAGKGGIPLKLTVHNLSGAGGGNLWICTDGTNGNLGGDGGDGAKGSAGPDTCAHKGDGGDGGHGGRGGQGGVGGNTARVSVTVNGTTISPSLTAGTAPSIRPTPQGFSGIVIAGSPGIGGPGGVGGRGGPGGEGYENHFPCPASDSRAGSAGAPGGPGPNGANGNFAP